VDFVQRAQPQASPKPELEACSMGMVKSAIAVLGVLVSIPIFAVPTIVLIAILCAVWAF
jgi:hypothetical protein